MGRLGGEQQRGPLVTTASYMPHGLLFDLDGTLLNSEWYWLEAEAGVLAKHGIEYTDELAEAAVGIPLSLWTTRMRDRFGIAASPEAMERELVGLIAEFTDSRPTLWRPGAYKLLERSVELGIPAALVTASPKVLADVVLTRAPVGALRTYIAGDMDMAPKPAADPYVAAARLLGVNPRHCVAFEDSPFGIRAAMAARTHAVLVPFMVTVPEFEGVVRISSLEDVDDDFLRHVMTLPLPAGDPLGGTLE